MPSLGFEPLIPLALWLSLALTAGGALAWYAWRRPGGMAKSAWRRIIAVMGLGMTLVLVILLNPMVVEPLPLPPGKPQVTILIDTSASMAAPMTEAGVTRYQAVAEQAQAFAVAAKGCFDVRVLAFAANTKAMNATDLAKRQPEGDATDLATAVREGLVDEHPHGQLQILLSDGIHTGEGGAAQVLHAARTAKALACPIFTHTFGGDSTVKDLAIELRSPHELTFVGQKAPVVARVKQRGLGGVKATVTLHHEGKQLGQREVDLPQDGAVEASFDVHQDRFGQYRYEVRVSPAAGEVSLINNAAPLVLRVVDQPVRVLLLEGKPYWDGKFLMRTLASDPSIELDCVVRVSESRLYRRTLARPPAKAPAPAVGNDKESKAEPGGIQETWKVVAGFSDVLGSGGLGDYQVIVLGRDAETFLTDDVQAQLRAWLVQRGGALVCYRGQPVAQLSQRMSQILPVRWTPTRESRLQWSLTERGRDLRWLPTSDADALTGLPSLASVAVPDQPRPLSVVLATAHLGGAEAASPMVTYQPFGLGRVVTIEGAGMWRWAFLPPPQKQHDHVYLGLWHNLLRWLVSNAALLPGQTMALRSDKVRFDPAEAATATLLLRADADQGKPPQVELTGDALAKPRSAAPVAIADDTGAFRVAFGRLPEGRYLAKVIDGPPEATTVFDVRSISEERLDLKARPDLMVRIAEESGGESLGSQTPAELADQLHEHLQRKRMHHVRRVPLWDRWWVLLGVLAIWCGTWARRRSRGLI